MHTHPNHNKYMTTKPDSEQPETPAEEKELVGIASADLLAVLRCLRLLQECPPTVRQIIENGDRAIEAAGLYPWCMNEGLAEGNERHVPWQLEDCIQTIAAALSSAIRL
jgi:hypothetical protein